MGSRTHGWLGAALGLSLALGMPWSARATSLFTNGSFENLNNTFVNQSNGCMAVYANDSTTIPDWTVSSGTTNEIAWCNGTLSLFPAADGNFWVDLTGFSSDSPNGAIRQTISVATGVHYTIDFYASTINDTAIGLDVNGTSIAITNPLGVGLYWTLDQGSFVGGADTSPYVEFYNPTPGANAAIIDLASVTVGEPVGVPEPSGIGLLGLAISGLGLLRRRRRSPRR
jgi:hypothetical protein